MINVITTLILKMIASAIITIVGLWVMSWIVMMIVVSVGEYNEIRRKL